MTISKAVIDETLNQITETIPYTPLKKAMRHALLAGGKRIRPLLMLKVIEAHDLDATLYLHAACTIEMLHTYTLVHDDLPAMDDDDMRRSKPTVHKQFDEATAILTGDALLTDAFYHLATDENLTAEQSRKCIEILTEKTGSNGTIKGQMLDIVNENTSITLGELQKIHTHKTANLIQAALMMGAVIVGEENLTPFEQIGEKLGLAFQIQDDLLEATSDETTMGKTLSDARNQKTTYYTLLGETTCQTMLKDAFHTIYDILDGLNLSNDSIHKVIKQIETRTN